MFGRSGLKLLAAIGVLAGGGMAHASTVSFVNPVANEFSDCTPYCTPQFQEMYDSAAFSGAVSITGIQFKYSAADANDLNYTISLSTTSAPVFGLSANFASNRGADVQVFYQGVWAAPDVNGYFTYTGTPFNYDPSMGNLLLEITHTLSEGGCCMSSTFSVDRNYSFSTSGDGSGDQHYGIQTVFTVGPALAGNAPEPATWALMIGGFGLAGTALRRRRTAIAA